MRLGLGIAAAVAAVAGLSTIPSALAQSCNGNSALCGRQYSNVTQVGSHDSAFVGDLLTDNQYISLQAQLDMGIRFLQAQTHNLNGVVELCHTYCWEEDAGSLLTYLSTVQTWLAANPGQVLTLLLTNGDAIPVADFGSVFAAAGLDSYAFSPDGTLSMDEWPTLQTLITNNTPLVVFMDYHADTTVVPYILDEFTYFFETPYDTTDPSFPECTLDRPPGGSAEAAGRMMIVNHFLDYDILGIDIPDQIDAAKTNSVSSILAQSDICDASYGRVPNFILLDWVNVGQALAAQDQLNNLS